MVTFALGLSCGFLISLVTAFLYGQHLVDKQEKKDEKLFKQYADYILEEQTLSQMTKNRYEG
jgi:hypothetical protein